MGRMGPISVLATQENLWNKLNTTKIHFINKKHSIIKSVTSCVSIDISV